MVDLKIYFACKYIHNCNVPKKLRYEFCFKYFKKFYKAVVQGSLHWDWNETEICSWNERV